MIRRNHHEIISLAYYYAHNHRYRGYVKWYSDSEIVRIEQASLLPEQYRVFFADGSIRILDHTIRVYVFKVGQ